MTSRFQAGRSQAYERSASELHLPWPTTSSVVGTGVDPVTSRFSDRNAEKDNPCSRPAGGSKEAGKSENSALRWSSAFCRGSPCSRVRVGTLWARSLTDTKYLTAKNIQDGSHQVARRDLLMARQYKVLIERGVARGEGSVSG